MTLIPRKTPRRRRSAVAVAVAVLAGIGAAQAAWQVTDQQAETYLRSINDRLGNGDANDRLKKIYEVYQLGSASESGDTEPEPTGKEQLSKTGPSTIPISVDERCPAAKGEFATSQRQICEEIMDTERAKYMYSIRMYQLTDKRKDRLKALEKERTEIHEYEYGKLQDNSNRLLALMSLMQLDAQRHRTYMDAYDARITYLRGAQNTLAQRALRGANASGAGGLGGSLGSVLVGGGTLKLALDAMKSHSDYHFD